MPELDYVDYEPAISQPMLEFAFGLQPTFAKERDKGLKIEIMGAGDVFTRFVLPALAQRKICTYSY